VFERHPRLKLVITENPGIWWTDTLAEMDSVFKANRSLAGQLSRMPSEYCYSNVFVGASFMSHKEATVACRDGYYTNYLWGSDYPHIEGTWQNPKTEGARPSTHLALQFAFAELPREKVLAMLGENAVRVYDLDRSKLVKVAERINVPAWSAFERPFQDVMKEVERTPPAERGLFSFRTDTWS
jgi:predicted TIM-barrel fold metal-dependent hydrolase